MSQTPNTTPASDGPGRAKVAIAIGIGAAIAIGMGAGAYAVWQANRPKPANVSYDLTPLRRTDPALIVGRQMGTFRPGFQHARCIAVAPDGKVYVSGDMAIRRFDANGRKLSEISTDNEAPGAISIGKDGAIFATFGAKVCVYDPNGRRVATWPERQGAILTSIAVTDDGVFVANASGRVVLLYSRDGELKKVIGEKDDTRNSPGFLVPSPYFDVAMAPDGMLRVTHPGRHQVEMYSAEGDRGTPWGHFSMVDPAGFVGCCNPANFAILTSPNTPGGLAAFVTAEKGLSRIKVFDPDGEFVGYLAGPDTFARHDALVGARPSGQPFMALDVAAGANGQVYVLDGAVGEVRVFEWKAGDATDDEVKAK